MNLSRKLVLGIKTHKEQEIKINPETTRNWELLENFLEEGQNFIYTEIEIRKDIARRVEIFCDKWDADLKEMYFGIPLRTYVDYDEDLQAMFNVGCQDGFRDLRRRIYPIDIHNTIKEVSLEPLPDDLDDFLVFNTPLDKVCGCIGRWHLFLLNI